MESVQQRRRPHGERADAAGPEEPPDAPDLESAAGRAADGGKARRARARASSAPAWVVGAALWLLLALLWIRWPVARRAVFAPLEAALGKLGAEPAGVALALALPFLLLGLAFYLRPAGARPWRLRAPARLAALARALWPSAAPADALAAALLLVLQLNLLVGKLLMDAESGKLAKAGVADRLVRALGTNALYALVAAALLLARGSFAHALLGLSPERAARLHVVCGQLGGLLLAAHGGGYVLVWLRAGTLAEKLVPCLDPAVCSPKAMYGTTRNFFGLLALLAWLPLALGAQERVRRRHFRWFAASHALALPALALASALHYYATVSWLVPALLLHAVYRVASARGRGRARVRSLAVLAGRTLRIELAVDRRAAWEPGQFVYLQAPALGSREWHPFSISAAPLRGLGRQGDASADCSGEDPGDTSLWLDVRVQRGFTLRLMRLARRGALASVRLDGFYGSRIAARPHTVLVAGGSGMAPFLALLERLARAPDVAPRPQSLWIIWTSRGSELMDEHCQLLDAVRRSPRWRSRVWLHVTEHAGAGTADEDTDADATDLDDDDSDVRSPRVERLAPSSDAREDERLFRGRFGELVSLPLFAGALAGAALCMAAAYAVTDAWYLRRPLLLVAAGVGAFAGAWAGARLVDARAPAAYERVDDAPADAAESPSGPAAAPTAATLFKMERGRPELGALLAAVAGEVREEFGPDARTCVWVSGPPGMQREAVGAARALGCDVHEKAFEL